MGFFHYEFTTNSQSILKKSFHRTNVRLKVVKITEEKPKKFTRETKIKIVVKFKKQEKTIKNGKN